MDYKVKRKGFMWNFVPLSGRNRFSVTIGSTIYLTPKRYDNYQSKNPSNSTIALVEHEKVHVAQKQNDKWFGFKYLLSRKARFIYEVKACAIQADKRIQLLPCGEKTIDNCTKFCERYAKTLSSWNYLLFMGFDKCFKAIQATVVSINMRRNKSSIYSIFTKEKQ